MGKTAEKATAETAAPKPKARKPRTKSVAAQFAEKIEKEAQARLDAACKSLYEAVTREATNIGETVGISNAHAFIAVAVGKEVGVAQHNIAASKNKILPALTEKMLENSLPS